MTENEEKMESLKEDICLLLGIADFSTTKKEYERLDNSCKEIMICLDELEKYRAIGTVEELKTMKENGAFSGVELAQILAMQMELKKYHSIGTVEELQKSVKEEDVLKFYYIESEDKYVVGQRVDTLYYAEVGKTGLAFYMSRYLPWGKHIVAPDTLWKEHTYPSEPKEIPFFDWLQGFMKKEYGCTVEEVKNAYGRGYNQCGIDRAEELQKCREYGYNKAIDECIRLIEETPWKDTNMLVESIRELKGGAIDG